MNKVCKAGVEYDSFGQPKMGVIPCIKGGTASCVLCVFPTQEAVMEKLGKIGNSTSKMLKVLIAVKNHHKQHQKSQNSMKCPHGDHDVYYAVAHNGHFRVNCTTCQISFME